MTECPTDSCTCRVSIDIIVVGEDRQQLFLPWCPRHITVTLAARSSVVHVRQIVWASLTIRNVTTRPQTSGTMVGNRRIVLNISWALNCVRLMNHFWYRLRKKGFATVRSPLSLPQLATNQLSKLPTMWYPGR